MSPRQRISELKNSQYLSIIVATKNWHAILLNKDNSPKIVNIKFWGIILDKTTAGLSWIALDEDCNSYNTREDFICLSHIVDLNQALQIELENKCIEKAKQLKFVGLTTRSE